MDGTATWFLTVTLWRGAQAITDGPYTEAECMRCGEAWYQASANFVKRNPKLYSDPRFTGRSWACFERFPTDPPIAPTFPTLKRICEVKR